MRSAVKAYRKLLDMDRRHVTVLERQNEGGIVPLGRTIKNMVQRSNPFQEKRCENSESRGQCLQLRVYKVICKMSNSKYIYETSMNGYTHG